VSRLPRANAVSNEGTIYLEGSNLSRCRILIACRCACPGATTITNLSWVQEQKLRAIAAKSRTGGAKSVTTSCYTGLVVPRSGKQVTYVDRVRFRGNFKIVRI
jgi:hypothetical protein